MSTVAIILARAASTRLPNKMFLPFGKHSVLDHVIERVRACKHIDDCVLATSDHPLDQAFESIAKRQDIRWIQGSEPDVIGRMVKAIEDCSPAPTHVVRICSDNPMLMPNVIDEAIQTLGESSADLITPFEFHSYPFGFGSVVLTRACLLRLHAEAQSDTYREHVENYCFDHPDEFSILYQQAPATEDLHGLGMTLDYHEDYERLLRARRAMASVELEGQATALCEWVKQHNETLVQLVPEPVQVADKTHWGLQIPAMNGKPKQWVFIDGRPRHGSEDGSSFYERVKHRVHAQLQLPPHRTATGPSFSEHRPEKQGNTNVRIGFKSTAAAFFPPSIIMHLNSHPPEYLDALIEQLRFEPIEHLICLGPPDACRKTAKIIHQKWPNAPLQFALHQPTRSPLQRSFSTIEVSREGQLSIPAIPVVQSIHQTTIADFWHDAAVRRARVDALNAQVRA